jgi:hypothetical protein
VTIGIFLSRGDAALGLSQLLADFLSHIFTYISTPASLVLLTGLHISKLGTGLCPQGA